jgi:hypothetical protein
MLAMQKLTAPAVDDNAVSPACPSCGRALQLSRIMPGSTELPDLRTYACRGCGVWVTEAGDRGTAKDGSNSSPPA